MQTYLTMHLHIKRILFLPVFTSECKETSSVGSRWMPLYSQAMRGCRHVSFEASLSPDFPLLQSRWALTSDLFTLYWTYWSRNYSKTCPDTLLPKPHRAPVLTSSFSSVIECYHPLWHVMDMPWPHDIWCLESNFLTMHNPKLTTVFCLKELNLCYQNKYRDSNN